ncbi:hypothetical protein Tco_0603929 [Tanacetum coccineum]
MKVSHLSPKNSIPRTTSANFIVERVNPYTCGSSSDNAGYFAKTLMFLWEEAVATSLLHPQQSLLHIRTQTKPHNELIQVPVVLAGTPSSTTIDQDAPSTSYSPSSSIVQPPISHQGVAAGPTIKDNPFAQAEDDPFVNVFALEPGSEASSSGILNLAESNPSYTTICHLRKWSKVTQWDNVIW